MGMRKMRSLTAIIALTLLLSISGTVRAQEILLLDWATLNNVAQTALTDQGLAFTLTTDGASFEAALAAPPTGAWDLVVVDNPSNILGTAGLSAFIDGGGNAIVAYWDLDTAFDLQASFDVTAVDFTAPQEFTDTTGGLHCVWNGAGTGLAPISAVTPAGVFNAWVDNGDTMTVGVAGISEEIGAFTAGGSAVVVKPDGAGDQALVLAHESDTLTPAEISTFWQNAIDFGLNGCGPPNPCSPVIDVVCASDPASCTPTAGGDAIISWTDNPTVDPYTSVEISRDGSVIGTVGPGVETFTDVAPPSGIYTYSVQAICASGPTFPRSCTLNHCPDPNQILVLDWISNNDIAQLAIDCLGLTGSMTVVGDGASLVAELGVTPYATLVIDNPSNLLDAAAETAIIDFIDGGGNVFMSYWGMDTATPALQAALGISAAIDYTVPEGFSSGACCPGDSVWTTPNGLPGESVGPTGGIDAWFDDGDYLTVSTGTPRGEYAGGQIALVSGVGTGGGTTFLMGATLDSLEVQSGRDIVANCLEEMIGTGSGPCPLLNDTCVTATVIGAGATAFTSVGAVDEGFGASCQVGGANDVWYSYTPVCDGDHVIDATSGSFDVVMAVHEDCLGTEIDCATGGTGVTVTMTAGVTYLIQVSGTAGATGDGTVTVDASATAPANDDCANASVAVVGGNPFNTICATNDGPLATCGAPTPTDPDVWWTYTATADATVRFDTCSTAFDSLLEIFDDCPSTGGVVLFCNDDSCGLQSSIDVAMVVGDTVTIRLTGFAGATGAGDMTVTEILPLDVSGFDVALVNGELGGGLLDSHAAHVDALTAAGKSFIEITAGLGLPIIGCPNEGWIHNNGTFPDDAVIDLPIMTAIRDCVLAGNGAFVHGGDNWGFAAPTDYDQVDGIDEAATADGGDLVTDLEGQAGTFTDGLASVYTQDQAGNDWTDNLALAAPGAGTEIMGDNNAFVLFSPAAGYFVGVHYIHDDTIASGAGDTISISVEPAGFDDPGAFLASVYDEVFGPGSGGPFFARGDCNDDGGFDISDPVTALSILFVPGTPAAVCVDACDVNDDGGFDISDPVYSLSALFVSGSPPPAAPTHPTCGEDPTDTDPLDCASQPTTACP